MYKGIRKRLVAILLSMTMILGMTDLSILKVQAAGKDIGSTEITFAQGPYFDYTYQLEQRPSFTIIDTSGETPYTLIEGSDYHLNFNGVDCIGAGSKTVVIEGDGSYTGTIPKTFTIRAKSLKVSSIIKGAIAPKDYLGGVEVTLTENDISLMDGSYRLRMGIDYKIESYSDNYVAGNASVKLTGIGNYREDITLPFVIQPKDFDRDVTIAAVPKQEYAGRGVEIKPSVKITPKATSSTTPDATPDAELEEGVDYQLFYRNNDKAGTATIEITGMGLYTGCFKEVPFQIVKNISTYESEMKIEGLEEQVFNGGQIKPKVKVYDDGTLLEEKTHYTVSYGTNTNIGTQEGLVLIEGVGSYKGNIEGKFDIKSADLSGATITFTETCLYNGEQQKPKLEVKFGETIIPEREYKLTWGENINAGKGSVTIEGDGNLLGSKTVNFDIEKKSLSDKDGSINVTVLTPSYVFDGTDKRPLVKVVYTVQKSDGTTKEIPLKTDEYSLSYKENRNASKPDTKVIVTGAGNYKDSAEKAFSIRPADISGAEIEKIDPQTYTGDSITPTFSVKIGSVVLVKDIDYKVEFSSHDVAGTATISITGNQNYTGDTATTFEILPKDFSTTGITCELEQNSFSYTGQKIFPTVKVFYKVGTKTITVPSQEYTVTYDEDTNVDSEQVSGVKSTITITGKGVNYSGTITKDFTITPRDISTNGGKNVKIEGLAEFDDFNGSPVEYLKSRLNLTYDDGNEVQIHIPNEYYDLSYEENDKIGTAKIIVTGKGNFSGKMTENFYIKGDLSSSNTNTVVELQPKVVYSGEIAKPKLDVTCFGNELKAGTDYEIVCDDIEVGPAELTINATVGGKYYGAQTLSFEIIKKDINDKTGIPVNFQMPNQVYTGLEFSLSDISATLEASYGTQDLVYGTDYEIAYSEDTTDLKNVGVKKIVVTALDSSAHFTGKTEVAFEVLQRELTYENLKTSTFTEAYYLFNGTDKVMLTDNEFTLAYDHSDGVTLTEEMLEYDFEMVDNDQIGIAKLRVKGKGNFKGSVDLNFEIKGDLEYAVIAPITERTYQGSDIQPELTVTFENKLLETTATLEAGDDYTVSYDNNLNVNRDSTDPRPIVKITGSNSYANGNSAYFDIIKKNLSKALDEGSEIVITGIEEAGYEYTGSEIIIQNLALTNHGNAMEKERDYTVNHLNNVVVPAKDAVAADQPKIVISAPEGCRNYSGFFELNFKINPRQIESNLVTASGYQTSYDYVGDLVGQDITFDDTFKIFYDGNELIKGTLDNESIAVETATPDSEPSSDYTIKYRDNNVVGEAAVIVTGQGNYAGTREYKFNILGDLEDNAFKMEDIPTYPYSVIAVEPKIKAVYGTQDLIQGTHYKLDYLNNIDVATPFSAKPPTIIVIGIGKFKGIINKTFEITIRDLSLDTTGMTVLGLENGFEYTGKPIEPTISLKNNGYTVDPSQYEVTYEENIKGASAESEKPPCVVITGIGGNYTGVMRAPFTITGLSLKRAVVAPVDDQYYTGQNLEPEVVVTYTGSDGITNTLKKDEDYKLSWSNNKVVANTLVLAKAPTITIKGINNYSEEITVYFNILPKDMSKNASDFTFEIAQYEYTGNPIIPEVKVYDKGGVLLDPETDYDVSAGTKCTSAGEANVTITGKGNYGGQLQPTFEITGKDISGTDFKVDDLLNETYTSKEVTPDPGVSWGEQELERDRDYSIKYDKNVNAGKASLIIEGENNFRGSKPLEFVIDPKDLGTNITVEDIANQVYNPKGVYPKPVVRYVDADKGIDFLLTEFKDYTLTYSENTAIGKNTATVKINGIGNFSGFTDKTFTIVGGLADASISAISVQNYTGAAIEPKPTITMGGKTLIEKTHYELSYKNNISEGTATLTATGIGDYGGTKSVTFIITRDFSSSLTATGFGATYVYTGKEITPVPGVVTAFSKLLVYGKDYKINYSSNTNVGTATITITGIGNYKGSKSYKFGIVRRSIAQCTVSPIGTRTYNGKAQVPELTIKLGTTVLKKNIEYTVVPTNNVAPGTARLIIKGNGNYTGSKTVTFKIKQQNITGVKAAAESSSKIKLSWKKNNYVSGYEVYNTSNKRVAKIKSNSYTVSGLKAATSYSYKVRAYIIRGGRTYYSSFSSVVKAKTKAAAKPGKPTITVKSKKSKTAAISWKKVSGASGYEVYRSTKSGSGYKRIMTTGKTSYTNSKLSSKKRYYYKVRAFKIINGKKSYGSFSAVKYVTIK